MPIPSSSRAALMSTLMARYVLGGGMAW